MDTVKGWFNKGKSQASQVASTDVGKKVEDVVEDQAAKGGTLGKTADVADDQIDKLQGGGKD
jgi:hypothetical protein